MKLEMMCITEQETQLIANLPSLTGFEMMSVDLKGLHQSRRSCLQKRHKEDETSEGAIKPKHAQCFLFYFF